MKSMTYRSSILIALVLGFFAFKALKQDPPVNDKEAVILTGVLSFLENVHYQPKPLDDQFSAAVYKSFIERLDGSKRYFTQEDIKKLSSYETKIDDQVKAKTFEFFNETNSILGLRMAEVEGYFNELIAQKIDLDKKDNIILDGEKLPFAKNSKELKEYWAKFIRYEVLTRVERKIKDQNAPENKETKKSIDTLVANVKVDIKKTFGEWFARLNKMKREDRFESYLSSITNYYDPHTEYFNPKEKDDFDINMSNKLEGIGARLMQDGEYVKVSEIVVGGPAWKGKQLQADDVIRTVTQKGGEPLDITGMRLDDVVTKIRGPKGTVVVLEVKKKDGKVENIEIMREEVILDEALAKSSIIDINEEINRIGYIYLPKFYSSFDREGGTSCAVDIAKEIEKLKKENVNGIILDLRNNSGGSLTDVVDMSGLFIEKGPIVQVKQTNSAPYIYEDKNPEVNYNGPLIVMVNNFSASASEILAAAMQDYKRAIIVGSTTYGKGTVQRFYDLDRGIRGYDNFKPLGSLKMTMQKFFRINGGSTQFKGVSPDISLPDLWMYMDYGEKEYDYPLAYSEIAPVKYGQNVVRFENLEKVKSLSTARTSVKEEFKLIEEEAKMLKRNKDITSFPLALKDFQKMIAEREKDDEKFKALFKDEIPNLAVRNLKVDVEKMKGDEPKIKRNDDWISTLKKDVYLFESMLIMKDMIENEVSFVNQVDKIKKS